MSRAPRRRPTDTPAARRRRSGGESGPGILALSSALLLLLTGAGCSRDAEETRPAAAPPSEPASGEDVAAPTAPSPETAAGRPAGEIPEESRAPVDPGGPGGAPAPTEPDAAPPAAVPPAEPGRAAREAPAPAPPRAPVPEGVLAAIAAARELVAGGAAGDAVASLEKAEAALGESADLRLEQGRAFIALAAQALGRGEDSFLVKGLVADAHVRWKQATALDPSVPGAAVLRAQILRFEENPDAAREILDAHLAQDPGDAEAHALAGEMATASRDWQTADLHWTKVAELDPSDGRARLQATIAKQWLRVPAEVVERGYLEAARLLPADQEPVRLLAGLYPKDRERKLAVLRKAADADAAAVWPRLWIAHVLRTEGTPDLAEAKRVLDEAAKAAPENAAVRFNLGLVLESDSKPLEALGEYLACIERSPAGEAGQASDSVDRLLHDPASPLARQVPLTLRIRACDALVGRNPAVGRYGNNAGLWFRDVGRDYDASLRYYLTSVAAAPDDQDFLNDTGLIYLFHLTDRKDDCLPYFEKVRALVEEEGREPVRGYWDALENLCKYWFERGEWARVVEAAGLRANPAATLEGKPYPSARAAAYGDAAKKKLAGK